MIRLHVIAEGETEQTFVLSVLSPYLTDYDICCTSSLPGRRGGDINYPRFKTELLRLMSHDTTSFFSCMIDLYALNNQFPRYSEAQGISDVQKRVFFLEEALAQDINQSRFIPYIQLHEFEALIFTDVDKLKHYFLEDLSIEQHIKALKNEVSSFSNPEEINTGNQTAPSKRLILHIPGYKRAKATAGPIITQYIGLDVIRLQCPHFGDWFYKILDLKTIKP